MKFESVYGQGHALTLSIIWWFDQVHICHDDPEIAASAAKPRDHLLKQPPSNLEFAQCLSCISLIRLVFSLKLFCFGFLRFLPKDLPGTISSLGVPVAKVLSNDETPQELAMEGINSVENAREIRAFGKLLCEANDSPTCSRYPYFSAIMFFFAGVLSLGCLVVDDLRFLQPGEKLRRATLHQGSRRHCIATHEDHWRL